ncbi:cyclic nucleotide-gated channel rod photoreceptor subunit alpha-like [Octopus sinensis]|uniref:Cyclic nucleotide-gated channel rod photoreceptor subunit alpha-like n=1 Tax=Octopus sinensis TaxID=2607531 RepID=A0A7E6EIB6_9MOLL|nr:cyclic nucleotide-gated channel rod photoreceptor subunit alpha-like [Octopus sinensis]
MLFKCDIVALFAAKFGFIECSPRVLENWSGKVRVVRNVGFLEQGIVVTDIKKLGQKYRATLQFKLDIISVIPLDYLYFTNRGLFDNYFPEMRANRILKIYVIVKYFNLVENKTKFPNIFRVIELVAYILIIIHWNACVYFSVSNSIGFCSDRWVYDMCGSGKDQLIYMYIYSFYWSTLTLTTIGEVPRPVTNFEHFFVVLDFLIGVLIFATIVGNIGSMVTNINSSRIEFQQSMDGVKQYMELRHVDKSLQIKILKWFNYLSANKQSLNDDKALDILPSRLRAEIALNLHFETLKQVKLFKNVEAGLLMEVVLKLRLQVFNPDDYICRKGDIGREMYIVKKGILNVVSEDGNTIFATLKEGAIFGELSIMNIPGNKTGNKRSASIRSFGYSDLFVLQKDDLWDVLKEYPEAEKTFIATGEEILRKDGLLDEELAEQAKIDRENEKLQILALSSKVDKLERTLVSFIGTFESRQIQLKNRLDSLEGRINI